MKALRWSFEGFGVSSPFDSTFHYVTSPVFPPVILGALRLLIAVYTLITTIIILALDQNPDSLVMVLMRGNELIIPNTGTCPTLHI